MTITPAGLPAWSRSADHTYYGGHPNKANYQSQGVVNPRTDVGAEAIARLSADLAAAVNTSPMWVITYLDGGGGAPTVESVYGMTGVRTTSYGGGSPPTGFPSAARNGTGDVTFTFASSYADPYGVTHAWVPVHVTLGFDGGSFLDATWVISGSTVRVRCWDAAGGALGSRRVTLVVH